MDIKISCAFIPHWSTQPLSHPPTPSHIHTICLQQEKDAALWEEETTPPWQDTQEKKKQKKKQQEVKGMFPLN